MFWAIDKNNLEQLKIMRTFGVSWGVHTCARAAQKGHLDILKWLRANSCPWDQTTCIKAASHGHLDVLKWAHANGCTWGVMVCWFALINNNLNVLKWLRANGCPWNKEAIYAYICADSPTEQPKNNLDWVDMVAWIRSGAGDVLIKSAAPRHQ